VKRALLRQPRLSSHVFGVTVWMYGWLITNSVLGGVGLFVGLLLGAIGVAPVGIVASAWKG